MAPPPDLNRRRWRWIPVLAAVGFSSYAVYKLYNLPSVSRKRRHLSRLAGTLISLSSAAASAADAAALVSSDLNRFLTSDSDELPTSLKQISKISSSDEFSASVSRVSESLITGILRGFGSSDSAESRLRPASNFSDRILDKLFSSAESGFASVVVGSFARNLVIAFYSMGNSPEWVDLICGDKVPNLIGDWVQLFVSTAVTVYLDKTMEINTYDQFFSGLTNPEREAKVREILVSICKGAVETLVKTSHQVLTDPNSGSSSDGVEGIGGSDNPNGGWVDRVSSTLSVPSNRSFVLDMTGRVTFETVKSFLDFALWNLYGGAKRGVNAFRDEVIDRGLEVVRYISAKSLVIVTICIALCMHTVSGARMLMPA